MPMPMPKMHRIALASVVVYAFMRQIEMFAHVERELLEYSAAYHQSIVVVAAVKEEEEEAVTGNGRIAAIDTITEGEQRRTDTASPKRKRKSNKPVRFDPPNNILYEQMKNPLYLDFERGRALRFPSVSERVKFYASSWYLPPCPGNADAVVYYKYIDETRTRTNNNETNDNRNHNPHATLELRYKHQTVPAASLQQQQQQQQPAESHTHNRILLDTLVDTDRLFHVRSEALINCTLQNPIDTLKRIYCPELFKFVMPFRNEQFEEVASNTETLTETNGGGVPLLAQVGDAPLSKNLDRVHLPHLKKTRMHIDPEQLRQMTSSSSSSSSTSHNNHNNQEQQQQQQQQDCWNAPQRPQVDGLTPPILWKIKFKRHFPRLHRIPKEDRPWHQKRDSAIFRGTFTGPNVDALRNPDARCRAVPRCRMVQSTTARNSTLVDAKFVRLEAKVPDVVGGVNLTAPLTFRPAQLQHKGLIMPEGNDVSSGLKWALLSNSVVLSGPPTATSWAMEALLVPWIHYVPLQPDLSDVEEKMQWILDHDREAQYIAQRGALWIRDLLFHKDSEPDNDAINREVLQRYAAHFRPMEDESEVDGEVEG